MNECAEDFWNPERYARDARFVTELALAVLELLDPRPGERILDLGCGDGRLTLAIRERGAAVVGVDAAPAMVKAARARGLEAHHLDARNLAWRAAFDAVFTNAVLHWIRDGMDEVLAGVLRALRPGGRFVGEFGGFGNIAAITTALRAVLPRFGIDPDRCWPWHFPSDVAWREALLRHGFVAVEVQLLPRPTPLEHGIEGWLRLFAAPLLAALAPAERERAVAEIAALLRPALYEPGRGWYADYVRLRFRARRPPEGG